MAMKSRCTTENQRRAKRRFVLAGVGISVAALAFFVVWFVLSGFALGFGADDDYYGDGRVSGEYGEPDAAAAHGEIDGQSDSSSSEFPASTGWSASDRADAQSGTPKQPRSLKIVQVASQQIGNIGGRKYWSWYGYPGRVEWCACFVSWCADRCGYISAGIVPKFSAVVDGVAWFEERQQWHGRGYTPLPGDIIFFDWQQDGTCDHVGIVERTDGGRIYTIEGNSLNMCRRKSYPAASPVIYGYGAPRL